MYPFERFSERAKKVLTLAQEEAERSGQSYIGTEHLLLGLLRESNGIAQQALQNLGVDISQVRQTIESVLGRNERIIVQQIIPTTRVKKVIEISFEEAQRMGDHAVGTHHLLLGLLLEGEGIAAHVLQDLGATGQAVRAEIERLLLAGTHEEPGAGASLHGQPPTSIAIRSTSSAAQAAVYFLGERVLVHDAEPPYRLWEGRVAKVEDASYEVATPGHPAGEMMTANSARIHPIPMRWTEDCPFCKFG
jgi:ATP-dependent Clp protease ATP-binding subunit ClpA